MLRIISLSFGLLRKIRMTIFPWHLPTIIAWDCRHWCEVRGDPCILPSSAEWVINDSHKLLIVDYWCLHEITSCWWCLGEMLRLVSHLHLVGGRPRPFLAHLIPKSRLPRSGSACTWTGTCALVLWLENAQADALIVRGCPPKVTVEHVWVLLLIVRN